MAPASASDLISLPQGGGALTGIGEKFSPDLHTGTANLTIPLPLPQGRNGFQPDLVLSYSSGNGNGPFGLGWGLSVPAVTRKRVPSYDDSRDTFILAGQEDLVPVPGGPAGAQRYRPRSEGLFARILHFTDPADDRWELTTPDGRTTVLGGEYLPAGATVTDRAVVARPDRRGDVFTWLPVSAVDPFGNRIEYEWERDTGSDGGRRWDQLYLKRVRYADYTDSDGGTAFLIAVSLDYEGRSDDFSNRMPCFEIRTRRRCCAINVLTKDGTELVRTYELEYLDASTTGAPGAPLNGVSLLRSVRVVGKDGTKEEALPPTTFDYTAFDPERRDFRPLVGRLLPSRSLGDANLELADLRGAGMPDIVEIDDQVRVWRNRGDGRFDAPRVQRLAPAGVALADPGVELLDADGDGRLELIVSSNGSSGYYPVGPDGEWDRRSFRPWSSAPSFELDDPEVRLADLDGDGVTDALRSGSRLEAYFGDARRGWGRTQRIERQRSAVFPDVSFSDPRVRFADMTGDGLQDIVVVYDRNIEYWPSLGPGRWAPRIAMADAPVLPFGYSPEHVLLGDVDGDGMADVVLVRDGEVTLWANRSGSGFAPPVTIKGTPPLSSFDDVRLEDVLGTGVAGLLWTRDAGSTARDRMAFLDFTGGTKPYLLSGLDNHMGATTSIEYAPSTRFRLDDERRRRPWRTALPFPVQVVAKVEQLDVFSRSRHSTEFRYHDGCWDGAEQEFRGFGMVEQRAERFDAYTAAAAGGGFDAVPEASFSPPTLMKTWFHQGPVGDERGDWGELDHSHEFWDGDPQVLERPASMRDFLRELPRRARRDALRTLRGRVLRTELYALDGTERERRPYLVTEQLHGVAPLPVTSAWPAQPAPWQLKVFFPHTLGERTTQWERGEDPLASFSFTDHYDEHGLPTRQTSVALPRRERRRVTVDAEVVGQTSVDETRILAKHVRTSYAVPDIGVYIFDRAAHVHTFELAAPPEPAEADPGDLDAIARERADAARSVHASFAGLLAGWSPGAALPAGLRLTAHAISHYDGPAFDGRDAGAVGPYGAITRTEALAFGDAELDTAYGSRRPAYLGGGAALPSGAPASFATDLGYREESRSAAGYHDGWYVDTARRKFDFQDAAGGESRGVLVGVQDAMGNETTVDLDGYQLLPVRVEDAAGLVIEATFDYRVMQPASFTDPNETVTSYAYTPLGQLRRIVTTGRDGTGGTAANPGTEFSYDFGAYQRTRGGANPQPVYVHRRERVWHASSGIGDDVIETREYSDGFGRLLQTRAAADDLALGANGDSAGLVPLGDAVGSRVMGRVTVSGWRVYDNRGEVVERFEPFFSDGWDFQATADVRKGRSARLVYDPLGRLVRTIAPDGSETRTVHGTPSDLADPDEFEPTPWESCSYDENDLAPVSKGRDGASLAARAPTAHHYTPRTESRDALGRPLAMAERAGAKLHLTRSAYDLSGNLLEQTDQLGRSAQSYAYDLLGRRLRSDSIDAGVTTTVPDAQGRIVETRQSNGAVSLRTYDAVHRATGVWARDASTGSLTQRERVLYGDTLPAATALAGRLRGHSWKHWDEAGMTQADRYDLSGQVLRSRRWVVDDAAVAAGWTADWNAAGAEAVLEPEAYELGSAYDALGRQVRIEYPEDVSGARAVAELEYGHAGLRSVTLDGDPYVTEIALDPLGRRLLIAYGNGVMTRYAYDRESFQLLRQRSEAFTRTGDDFRGKGDPFQDLAYEHDLVGNPTKIVDSTPGCGVASGPEGSDKLTREFGYDPLYRLMRATGRECGSIGSPRPLDDAARCGSYPAPHDPSPPTQANAPNTTRLYVEQYEYDPAGNMLRTSHARPPLAGNDWVRKHTIGSQGNRLDSIEQDGVTTTLGYDASGHLLQQNTERSFGWDHAGRLASFVNQPAGGATPSREVRHLYGADGQRVKKWVRAGGTGSGESTVYVAGIFEHFSDPDAGFENNQIHVMEARDRVALVRRGPAYGKDAGPEVAYHLADHLGSSNVVVKDDRGWVNREEYAPFGDTVFGGYARKRYRHGAKERDEETGLYYHGARYYAPWQSRWISPDPSGPLDHLNLYVYLRDNPIRLVETDGRMSRAGFKEHFKNIGEQDVNTQPGDDLVKGIDPTLLELRQYHERAKVGFSGSLSNLMGGSGGDKYVYTSHAGVVDLEHMLGVARWVYGSTIKAEAAGLPITSIVSDDLLKRELAEGRGLRARYSPSAYAADDMPSNALGALFGQHLLEFRKKNPKTKIDVGKELQTFLDHVGWLSDPDTAKVGPKLDQEWRETHKAFSAEPQPITTELIDATGGSKSPHAELAGKSGTDLLGDKGIELDPAIVVADPDSMANTQSIGLRWKGGSDPLLPAAAGKTNAAPDAGEVKQQKKQLQKVK
jgi:RHS repeat-associated protein